jgi:hypothetical protein
VWEIVLNIKENAWLMVFPFYIEGFDLSREKGYLKNSLLSISSFRVQNHENTFSALGKMAVVGFSWYRFVFAMGGNPGIYRTSDIKPGVPLF